MGLGLRSGLSLERDGVSALGPGKSWQMILLPPQPCGKLRAGSNLLLEGEGIAFGYGRKHGFR